MGGPTQNDAAGTPPIDIHALTAPDLRGLMIDQPSQPLPPKANSLHDPQHL